MINPALMQWGGAKAKASSGGSLKMSKFGGSFDMGGAGSIAALMAGIGGVGALAGGMNMGGIGDFIFGKDYSKVQGKMYDTAMAGVKSSQASSQAALMKALGAIQNGYGSAQGALTQQGGIATKALLDREKASLGANTQSMISRGMYGSTALDSGQRGITSDTNSALAELSSMLAQIGSNIEIGQGQAIAGAYGDIANSEQGYAGLLGQIGVSKAQGVEQGRQGGIMDIIGQIAGMYTMGLGMGKGK
jgi:hypothetical protein